MAKDRKSSAPVGMTATISNDQGPIFDDAALSSLATRIDEGFRKGQNLNKDRPKERLGANKKSQGSLRKNDLDSNIDYHDSGGNKKRDAQGNVKIVTQKTAKKVSPVRNRNAGKDYEQRELLLHEILTLGGTEDDFELVAEVGSDVSDFEVDEIEVSAQNSNFRKDFSKFVEGLGIIGHDAAGEADFELGIEEGGEREDAVGNSSGYTVDISGSIQNNTVPVTGRQTESSQESSSRLMFEARPDWHAANLPELPVSSTTEHILNTKTISELKNYAITLLEEDNNLYSSKHLSSTSSHRFLSTIMSSGTLSDKVSALTLVVQESPVHTTKSFESLISLSKKRSRGQAISALGALKDLLGAGVVLPTDRRLFSFENQPGLKGTLYSESIPKWKVGTLPGKITKAHLISWAYEDWLKERYFEILKVLEGWCSDEVDFARGRAITYVFELLREKPEQESNLLRLLVNKLGDPDKKLASRTSYLILQLQTTHPLMKPIIIRAIENEVLLRPGQSSHAKYYAINTLNQTILSTKEEDVARHLLRIYFELFVALLKQKDPLPELPGPNINRKGQTQGGGGKKGKKAKAKEAKQDLETKSGEELTEKMISVVLTGVNRALPFSDSDDNTLEQHMNTLFKITHSSNFNTSIQALMLIQQLATSRHLAVERFYRTLYESLLDPRLINSSKHAMYLNLLFRALKSDLSIKRVKAFVKRLLQIITLHQPPFICGILYLLRELEGTFQGISSMISESVDQDGMEEESFRDVLETPEFIGSDTMNKLNPPKLNAEGQPKNSYDGRKRDPEHSNADKSCLWELLPFLGHFHPSVSLFASRLLSGTEMPAKPDLASHSLINFLDKFVYRHPKSASGGLKGSSIMQPLAGSDSQGILVSNRGAPRSQASVNSEAFWRKKAEDIAADEVFFHRYFSQIHKSRKEPRKKDVGKNHESGNIGEEEDDEDEIWQALVESRPEVEGPSDDDSDLEMLDLDDSEDMSSTGSVMSNSGMDLGVSHSEGSDELEDIDEIIDDNRDEDSSVNLDELFARELQTTDSSVALEAKETKRQKKRRLKDLPTFAAMEDYAAMLEDDDH